MTVPSVCRWVTVVCPARSVHLFETVGIREAFLSLAASMIRIVFLSSPRRIGHVDLNPCTPPDLRVRPVEVARKIRPHRLSAQVERVDYFVGLDGRQATNALEERHMTQQNDAVLGTVFDALEPHSGATARCHPRSHADRVSRPRWSLPLGCSSPHSGSECRRSRTGDSGANSLFRAPGSTPEWAGPRTQSGCRGGPQADPQRSRGRCPLVVLGRRCPHHWNPGHAQPIERIMGVGEAVTPADVTQDHGQLDVPRRRVFLYPVDCSMKTRVMLARSHDVWVGNNRD